MHRRLLGALALAILSTFAAGGCATTIANPHAAKLDALFADLHQRQLFSGAVVVGEAERIVWEGGYGLADVQSATPFTPDTLSDSGSLAKTFTAALVIALDEEGVLDLDAPAQKLLPELPYRDITLRHLLSHSSGLRIVEYEYFDRFLGKDEIRTTERLLSIIAAETPPLAFVPGSAFEYSSFGFDLAALAAAGAAGKPYGDLLGERFFRPLGIASAFLRPARLSEFPSPRTRAYRSVAGRLEPHDVFDLEAFHGGSNIYISARDLHRWNASFLTRSLLSDAARERALEPARIGGSPSGLTLGSWYHARDGSAHWYSGHLQGFHNEVFRDTRTRRSIVWVSNNTIEPWLMKAIVRSVSTILDGGEAPSSTPPVVAAVRAVDRDLFAGSWTLSDGTVLSFESSEDRITVTAGGVSYPMFQVQRGHFYVPGLDWVVSFAKGANRGPTTVFVESNLDVRRGARR